MIRFCPGLVIGVLAVVLNVAGSTDPQTTRGGASVSYLGHCGFAVKTDAHLLIFDYQEKRDGPQPKVRPARASLATGWIDPEEIKDVAVRVFVSHSHEDHYDPVVLSWKGPIKDIDYYFGWKAADDTAYHYLVGPRAELRSSGLEIATINSHHSGVPEVAWLVKADGLVIYHNGDCQPDDPVSAYDFLRTKTDRIDLAFVPPVYEDGLKYTVQNLELCRRFSIRAVIPMHVQAGGSRYLEFRDAFRAKVPGLSIHVPMTLGQRFELSGAAVR